MVERRDLTNDGEDSFRVAEVVRRHVGQAFDLADDVVAEVPDDATVQRRQVGQGRRAKYVDERFERRQRAAIKRHLRWQVALNVENAVAQHERGLRRAPDEAEATPPLTLDRLEQEPGLVADEAHEFRQRRGEIGEQLAPDRNDAVPRRQRAEVVPTGLVSQELYGSR